MKVLLAGGGGREHAIAWALSRSGAVDDLIVAPGNPGIAGIPGARCVSLPRGISLSSPSAPEVLADIAESESADLTVVGPEDPLVAGVADVFAARGLRLFGPSGAAARLEGSKQFAKEIMAAQSVPTAVAKAFAGAASAPEAKAYLGKLPAPWVVKADGLAAGKGVLVTSRRAEAARWIDSCLLESRFGEAGSSVLIEEFLEGPELSLLCATDGQTVVPLAPARDHKRLSDGDDGPNTGGMGAYSPVPEVSDALIETVVDTIVEPVLAGLVKDGAAFRGILYAGLVLTDLGPKVLEFNVRFGDPEAQAVLPRLDTELLEIVLACTEGGLGRLRLTWKPENCVTVVAAAHGYPDSPRKGDEIRGLDAAANDAGTLVFHAGTAVAGDDAGAPAAGGRDTTGARAAATGEGIVTAGGRVLAVSGLGADLADARNRAYGAIEKISFDGIHYRTDIAAEAAMAAAAASTESAAASTESAAGSGDSTAPMRQEQEP